MYVYSGIKIVLTKLLKQPMSHTEMYNRGDYVIDYLIIIVIVEFFFDLNRNRNRGSEFLRFTTIKKHQKCPFSILFLLKNKKHFNFCLIN